MELRPGPERARVVESASGAAVRGSGAAARGVLAGLVLTAVASCGGGDDAPSFVVRDSAGVAIADNVATTGSTAPFWHLAASPSLADDRDLWHRTRNNGIELSRRFDRAVIAERTNDILTAVANGETLPEVSW